ncbi:MAG: Uncharacterised protein [Bacteroidetes bacterium MED-G17]|nr:MAG: Uncharacterised protein [Bacteroidetes bacterium MED-G17]
MTVFPSGEKVTASGSTPTSTEDLNIPSVSKNPTKPFCIPSALEIATATMPPLTATLCTPSPISETSIELTNVGLVGSLASIISIRF